MGEILQETLYFQYFFLSTELFWLMSVSCKMYILHCTTSHLLYLRVNKVYGLCGVI